MDLKKLLSKMTLEQKLAQLTQVNANCLTVGASEDITGPEQEVSLTRADVASAGSTLNFENAAEGIRVQKEHLELDPNKIPLLFMHDVIHGYKTIYPIPLALGASFDTDTVEECCAMASDEMTVGGVHVTFAPMVDLVRDPRWGRCMEATGEDPYLNCDMARAMVRGFQKSGKVAACVKHFAAYGQSESGLDYSATDMSERTLRDFYLPAYKAAIDEGVEMLMTSFNILNGVPSSGNKWLVKNLLRDEWGYDKIVISDYNAFREMKALGFCETEKECAKLAIDATSDIEMMSPCYLQNIPQLINEGVVSEEQIDEAVMRVLRLKEKLGLFENPYLYADPKAEEEICLCEKHRDIARRAAEKSAVLLKNDNVLPFNKNAVKRVAVIGPFADRVMLGNWLCHGKESEGISALTGIKGLLKKAEVLYSKGCLEGVNECDCSLVEEAKALAKECDAVIICAGEDYKMSGESMSRAELRLSPAQKTLIREVGKVNKNTAVVLFSGRALVLTDIIEDINALVLAWQPGTEGGNAIANLLFGEVNFGAKLPMTFPRSEGQIPAYYNCYRSSRPYEGPYGCWYIDMPKARLFEFGYGLSYTSFEVSDPELSSLTMNKGESIEVSVNVKNVGEMAGETVVQLYIRDDFASLARPNRELKGYKKIFLNAGEAQRVIFTISEEQLKFWSINNKFEAEEGSFTLWVNENGIVNEADGVKFNLLSKK